MTFGLLNVVQSVSGRNLSLEASNLVTEVVHILASKMLNIPLFTTMEWSSSGIQLVQVFHLACRILKRKAPLSSLTVAQATADLLTTEDPKEAARWRVRLAAEAIASFNTHTSNGLEPTSTYDSSTFTGAIYLLDVVARPKVDND